MPKVTEPTTPLGAAIRNARKKILNLTQEELGDLLDVKANVLSRWETGENKPPVESLARLAGLAASTPTEELRLYSEWVYLAGFPRPNFDALLKAGAVGSQAQQGVNSTDTTPPQTMEGQMARAIVDFIPDSQARVQLVLTLHQAAQQWQAAATGNGQAQDQ